jgi:alpha-galactosidase
MIRVLIEMCHEMERVCPIVVHLNYVNPMAMNCWALNQASKVRTSGFAIAFSIRRKSWPMISGHRLRKSIMSLPASIIWRSTYHLAFYLRFERNGQDLYPEIRRVIREGRVPETNRVRYGLFKRLGYFVTESSIPGS